MRKTGRVGFLILIWIPFFFWFLSSCGPASVGTVRESEPKHHPVQTQGEVQGEQKIHNTTPSIEEQIRREEELDSEEKAKPSALTGQWECEELGDVLSFYGYSLPARFIFSADQSYSWEIVKNGVRVITSGSYRVEEREGKPDRIFFSQLSEQDPSGKPFGERQKKELQGIFEIRGSRLKTVFYDREFIPEVDEFKTLDTQTYRRRR